MADHTIAVSKRRSVFTAAHCCYVSLKVLAFPLAKWGGDTSRLAGKTNGTTYFSPIPEPGLGCSLFSCVVFLGIKLTLANLPSIYGVHGVKEITSICE